VDCSSAALAQVGDHLRTLGAAGKSSCHPVPALQFLQTATARYDIVFIDPPFQLQLVAPVCATLAQLELLGKDALVYVEMGATESPPTMPPGWRLHREKFSGGVAYRLFRVNPSESLC
jgi:16S rRNA (guanine966-N2)-methyltransferase